MLNKSHLSKLFEDTDINIPVTIFHEPQKKNNSYAYMNAWYQTISNALEASLRNCEQSYHFQITVLKGKVYTINCVGTNLMNQLHSLFKYSSPMSIRIDTLEDSDASWVIILKDDL